MTSATLHFQPYLSNIDTVGESEGYVQEDPMTGNITVRWEVPKNHMDDCKDEGGGNGWGLSRR